MYVSRVAFLWHVLLCVSVILFFYWMVGFEEATARLRQPAFTVSNSAQRGLKNGGSTEAYNNQQDEVSKSLKRKQTTESGKMTKIPDVNETKENKVINMKKLKQSSWKKKSKQPALFSPKDHQPGKLSKPVVFGLNIAKARLNYEFSDVKDNIRANTPQKRVPDFDPSKAKHPCQRSCPHRAPIPN